MTELAYDEMASGLRFPEGPVALADGSVLVVEIERGTLSRVGTDGSISVVADLGGGPNGAAIGPDGAVYVCNNGGFEWTDTFGMLIPGDQPEHYSGGRIERVDLATGESRVLYTHCGDFALRGPNDLVIGADATIWFTDHGKVRHRERDRGGVFACAPDGSWIREVVWPLDSPNGIGLSPDAQTLWVAETYTGRLFGWQVTGQGEVQVLNPSLPTLGATVHQSSQLQYFDSLAVEACGNVVVGTLVNGGLTVVAPDGSLVEHVSFPDAMVTNVCFGGPDRRTAYVTCSSTGKLLAAQWPREGLALEFNA